MEPESILLISAAILLLIDLTQIARPKVKRQHSIIGFYTCFLSFTLIAITYLSFIGGFLTSNFTLQQVYSYSSSSMTTLSKLYATWAGSAGSILLLLLLTSITWFALRAHEYKRPSKNNLHASLVLGVIVIFFVIAAIIINPFARYGTEGPIEGRGLNPVLQSPWMAIHPPIVFAGYIFVVLAFALTLAKMKTGDSGYERLFNFSVRAGWLFLTLGIGLGGLWAYEVLGWGGYWSWDPIETASLLPWVALTIYLTLQPFMKAGKSFLGEFSILLAFSSLMFLSALTRGGLLQSVHAYGLSSSGPFILFFACAMIGYFFYLKRDQLKPHLGIDFNKKSLKAWSLGLAIIALFGIFIVCFSGIVYSMVAQAIGANASIPGVVFYNYANFPFVIGLLFALIGFSIHQKMSVRLYLVLVALVAVCSIAFSLAGWPTNNVIANSGLPLIASVLVAAVGGLLMAVKFHDHLSIARTMTYFGLVIVLLGVFVSSTTQQTTVVNDVALGSTFQASGVILKLTQCSSCTDNSSIELVQGVFPQSSNLVIDTEIIDQPNAYNTQLSVFLFTAYGFVSQPTIIRTGTDDIYIHVNVTQEVYNSLLNSLAGNSSVPERFTVTVEKVPLINLIWIGVAILVIGGVISISSVVKQPKSPNRFNE